MNALLLAQILINNAGVYGKRGFLQDYSAEDFLQPYLTNAVGPFIVVQQLQKQGLLANPSLVVNISSIVASHGDPTVSSVVGGGYAYR
jgi:NAD(P)-dependent dehydrogenase (short-subunit alcohol dehydrogenase family)